jgi:hypothetical protein
MSSQFRKRLLRFGLVAIFTLAFLLLFPFLFIGVNIARDIYPASELDSSCFKIFHLSKLKNGFAIGSSICTETSDSYPQTMAWYDERGWYCDGLCEWLDTANIGFIHFEVFKGFFFRVPDGVGIVGLSNNAIRGRPVLFENHSITFGSE